MLAAGELEPGDVDQSTLDYCNCTKPVVPDCVFTPIPYFYGWDWGCNVYDPDEDYGDLGNFGEMCPTDVYDAQELCEFAKTSMAEEAPLDPEYWVQAPDGDEDTDADLWVPYDYPEAQDDGIDPITNYYGYIGSIFLIPGDAAPYDFETFEQQGAKLESDTNNMQWNQFGPEGGGNTRNVVVLGSSMMSTHYQFQNGGMCSAASTASDRVEPARNGRGMRGNDFVSSPAWRSRVPWNKALALARTGFASKDVNIGGALILDSCKNPWTSVKSPSDLGVEWLQKEVAVDGKVDIANDLMITDGGLINDQQTVDGKPWSDSLAGIVLCSAMDRAKAGVNIALKDAHAIANEFNIELKAKNIPLVPPTAWVERWVPGGATWKDALDVPAGAEYATCRYRIRDGNGIQPRITEAIAAYPKIKVPPLKRLWAGLPPDHAAWGTLAQISAKYSAIKVKQIWLQYPHMESAQVTVGGHDLAIFLPEGVSNFLVEHFGIGRVTIDAIDPVLKDRIGQVSDDLNELMYNALGCNKVQAFTKNHGPVVCQRDPDTNKPLVVITTNNYPGWGPDDHQRTIKGGMPHESSSGADKLGIGIVQADGAQ